MKPTITDVYCYYTGGGIYVYSAKYGDVFLYGSLDQYIHCYKVRGEILYQDEDLCEQFGWLDEMKAFQFSGDENDYYISPDEIQYPKWKDILHSIQGDDFYGYGTADMEETLLYWNPNLNKRTDKD